MPAKALPAVLGLRQLYWGSASCTGALPAGLGLCQLYWGHCQLYWGTASCTGGTTCLLDSAAAPPLWLEYRWESLLVRSEAQTAIVPTTASVHVQECAGMRECAEPLTCVCLPPSSLAAPRQPARALLSKHR